VVLVDESAARSKVHASKSKFTRDAARAGTGEPRRGFSVCAGLASALSSRCMTRVGAMARRNRVSYPLTCAMRDANNSCIDLSVGKSGLDPIAAYFEGNKVRLFVLLF